MRNYNSQLLDFDAARFVLVRSFGDTVNLKFSVRNRQWKTKTNSQN